MSSYDQNLLGEAPKATRAQLQEGYSVDLLEQPADAPRRTPSLRSPTPHGAQTGPAAIAIPLAPAIAEHGSAEKFDSPAPVPLPPPKPKVSFWRTRNGIITIAVIALVVIGAVVGGAVGGTVGTKSSSNNVASSHSTSISTTSALPSTDGQAGNPSASQQVAGLTITSHPTVTTAKPTASGGGNIIS